VLQRIIDLFWQRLADMSQALFLSNDLTKMLGWIHPMDNQGKI
jgi:hypothetical protein